MVSQLLEKTELNLEDGVYGDKVIYRNPDYDTFFKHETDSSLDGLERGVVTNLGAVSVDTGEFTGRSAKDKYIVQEPSSETNIWWNKDGSDNKPISSKTWQHLKEISIESANQAKKLYVMDGYCGANVNTRLAIKK